MLTVALEIFGGTESEQSHNLNDANILKIVLSIIGGAWLKAEIVLRRSWFEKECRIGKQRLVRLSRTSWRRRAYI